MGWFDEQIRLRKEQDDQVLEDALVDIAASVMGRQESARLLDSHIVTKAAIDEILKYFHFKPKEVPENSKDLEEQLEFSLRPYGIMKRLVKLEEGWQRDAFGPMLGFFKKEGTPVPLLPSGLTGYCYIDPRTRERKRINKGNASLLAKEAYCFYRPLPVRAITIPDLILYLKNCLQPRDYALIMLCTLAITMVGMIMPRLTRALTGEILLSGSIQALVGIAIFMVATTLSSQLLSVANGLLSGRSMKITSISVEAAMMARLLSLSPSFFKKYSAGELASRSQAVNQLCSMLLGMVMSTGLTSMTSLLYITQIYQFAPTLLLPSLVVITVTVVFSFFSTLMQMRISKQKMEISAKESGVTYALISGIQKIRLSGAENRAFARWAKIYAKESTLSYNPPTILKINRVIMKAIGLFSTIIIYNLAIQAEIGVSNYMGFLAAYGAVYSAFSSLAGIALSVAEIKPVLEMAEPFLKAEPEVAEGKKLLTRVSGAIELNHVKFRYSESMPYVIDDLSLKIHPGEYVAIVGKTGCGKSTLIRLLLGFEKPLKGAIYYDGKDMNSIDLRSLRRKIGTVTQDGGLFQGSIYENISISAPHMTLEEAWQAAEIAGIAKDIQEMPMGMHTLISEGQGGISGGQRQRLMIARAIAPKPRILIFDEATSALDNLTQRKISEALDEMKCTRIVVAHRLSTIKNCDRIIVMNNGKIAEDGTYDELIAQEGFFAELVERQRLDIETK